ncbi:MAG: A/G-specific adenine glycosylase [Candidatus Saccharibacteria bacterium]|nr:A/G-specific adenine glycosylase [Candidatus Saccharibacteria bacterium]
MDKRHFQTLVHEKGQQLYRPMPWRDQPTLYYVLVSELMLQQTQVARVLPKFDEFIRRFPDVAALAAAELPEVLQTWQGLGYNRRAKFLHQAAQAIVQGAPTATQADLTKLPGIGPNTAGAIMNYVYNHPTPFVETNIRTVYFHHFFPDASAVTDKQLLEMVTATMDTDDPRQWFWALMDYGAELKAQGQGRLSTSRHYKKQSRFEGSLRQMRGEIIRRQAAGQPLEDITQVLSDDPRFGSALEGLRRDGLLADAE